jgi:NitT/TauT family transport system substrate-binding protein
MSQRLRFQLNTFRSGPQAWLFLAQERGWLHEAGVEFQFIDGDTAANTVPRMVAGGFEFGYGDINALVAGVAAPAPGEAAAAGLPLAVFAAYNRSPYTIAVAADGPVRHPLQLAGQHIVSHPNDAAWLLYRAFGASTGLDIGSTSVVFDEAPHSELVPRLLAGVWGAMFGFVNTLKAAAIAAGVDPARLRHFGYAEWVPSLYGMAVMVDRKLAARQPALVRAVLHALNRGLQATVADPQTAIDALAANAPELHRASNTERLLGTLALEMGGAEGARLGIGEIDDVRLAESIALLARTTPLPRVPAVSEVFSREFLPPRAERVSSLATAERPQP